MPAYNEERNIGRLLAELQALDPELEVVVVSDGSTDRTAEVAAAAGAHVVRLPFNLGIGGAVQTGFRYAWEGGYELAVRLDGDGQHDPAQLRAARRSGRRRRGRPRDRLALPRQRGLPLVGGAPRRHPRARPRRLVDRPRAAHRHDLGLPGAQPPHDRRSSPPTCRATTPRSRGS